MSVINKPLSGFHVLVAEDDAFQALDIMNVLEEAGAEVLGPAITLKAAQAFVKSSVVDCAVLDVKLGADLVFPVAQTLQEKGVAIVFQTGSSDLAGIKARWPEAQVLRKPVTRRRLLEAVIMMHGKRRLRCADWSINSPTLPS